MYRMPILISLITNGSTVMPNTSNFWLGRRITAKPIRAGTKRQNRRKGEQKLVRAGRNDVFLEEQFQAVGDRLRMP